MVATALLVATAWIALPGGGDAAAATVSSVSVTTGLSDGQVVHVSATGVPTGTTYLAVECGPEAITLYTGGWPNGDVNPEDGCEGQQSTVLFSGQTDAVSGSLRLRARLSAPVGPIDCTVEACFVAFFSLAGGAPLLLTNISFAADACAPPGSCQTGVEPGIGGRATAAPAASTSAPPPFATATSGHPAVIGATAGVAGDLSPVGAVTGEPTGAFAALPVPSTPVAGEGIVRLDLAAPGTDWGTNVPTSVVADVAVDGGTAQQLVLFRGATPFVYAGGLGPLTTGTHSVSIAVDDALSSTGSGGGDIEVHDVQLLVVRPDNPGYQAISHAPIVYGRSTSALHDTPLLEYATSSSPTGATHLGYTEVFSHEDVGTAFVPFAESVAWGRLTDIETFFSLDAAADGTPSNATFFSGAVPADYPDNLNAIAEVHVPFTGTWDGTHPIVRDATGNNDFSQVGTSAFRFRPVPVAPHPSGRPREAVMDANPWTYRVMGEEIARWYVNFTTDSASPEQGDARQYAYVELHATGAGVSTIGVDVQLDGSSTWYANDFGSGYPAVGGGTSRTVIKLPTWWMGHSITSVRLRVFPTGATSAVQVSSLRIFGLDQGWGFHELNVPTPTVVDGFLFHASPAPNDTTTTTTSTTTAATPSTTPLGPSTSVGATVATSPDTTVSAVGVSPMATPATPLPETPTYTG